MKANHKIITLLNQMLDHLEYYNSLAPFPIYDTGYIEDVKTKIQNMLNEKLNYDELPVVACKHCKSLHIQNDDVQNDVCMRCGATNEIIIYPNIDSYLNRSDE